MYVEAHLERAHGDVCLSPRVSFLDMRAVENEMFEKWPRQICSTAHVEQCSTSAEDEALLWALGAHRRPCWQPSWVT